MAQADADNPLYFVDATHPSTMVSGTNTLYAPSGSRLDPQRAEPRAEEQPQSSRDDLKARCSSYII